MGNGDITCNTGTVVSALCSHGKFATLKPDVVRKKVKFKDLVELLEEMLSFTYADILKEGKCRLEVIADDQRSYKHVHTLLPLEPAWEPGTDTIVKEFVADLGGGPVRVRMHYGLTYKRRKCKLFYQNNMRTSGAEIRLNGRVIVRGLMERIWGMAAHNSSNRQGTALAG